MIFDTLQNLNQYAGLIPAFHKITDFLEKNDLGTLETGRHEIDGDRLYVNVMEVDAHSKDEAMLEYHRSYIDLQIVISGEDIMGWTALEDLPADTPFDCEKDFALVKAPVTSWFLAKAGRFAIFFPEDAHAPCCGTGKIRKAVVKILI